MGKRILAGCLCALLTLVLLPQAARAAETVMDVSQGSIAIGATVSGKDASGHDVPSALNPDGYIITGTSTANTITVTNTTALIKITLDNVTIDAYGKNVRNPIVNLGVASQVLLTLKGTNTLKSSASYAAVHVPKGASLTIQGDGALYAFGGASGAGIGGSNAGQKDC